MIEITTLKQKTSLNLYLKTNEDLIYGHLAVAVTGYFQGIILGWVAGSL